MVLSAAGDQAASRSGLLLRSLLGGRILIARPEVWRPEPTERAKGRIPPRLDGGWDLVPRWWRLGGDVLQFAATPDAENPSRGDGRVTRCVTAAEETVHALYGRSLLM
jgi:hypothetical protein